MAINAMGPATLEIPEGGHAEFFATHYLLYRVEQLNVDTGEIEEYPRLVFFTRDGDSFATTGVAMPDRLRAILSLYSPEEWGLGIHMEVYSKKNRSGKGSHHELRVFPS